MNSLHSYYEGKNSSSDRPAVGGEGERVADQDKEDILSEFADRAPACGAGVACHISKCGKNVS